MTHLYDLSKDLLRNFIFIVFGLVFSTSSSVSILMTSFLRIWYHNWVRFQFFRLKGRILSGTFWILRIFSDFSFLSQNSAGKNGLQFLSRSLDNGETLPSYRMAWTPLGKTTIGRTHRNLDRWLRLVFSLILPFQLLVAQHCWVNSDFLSSVTFSTLFRFFPFGPSDDPDKDTLYCSNTCKQSQ